MHCRTAVINTSNGEGILTRGQHGADSGEDRAHRHQTQSQARDGELTTQAGQLKREGQSQLRAWKTGQAAGADDGLGDDARVQQRDSRRGGRGTLKRWMPLPMTWTILPVKPAARRASRTWPGS